MTDKTPIILFAFKRPEKLSELLHRVMQDKDRQIYVFCDGARNSSDQVLCQATQRIAKEHAQSHPIEVVVRPQNVGLSKNLIDGISAVLAKHPRAIIFEDDVHPKVGCIDFLEKALRTYMERDDIFSVGCYHRALPLALYSENVFLSPRFNCWGWGTWASRWHTIQEALQQDAIPFRYYDEVPEIGGTDIPSRLRHHHLKRHGLTWDTRVALYCLKNKWWQLQPSDVLIDNVGFDGSGTHCEAGNCQESFVGHYDAKQYETLNVDVRPDINLIRAIEATYADEGVGPFRRWRRKWFYRLRMALSQNKDQSVLPSTPAS